MHNKLRKYRIAELAYRHKIKSPQATLQKISGVSIVTFSRAWNVTLEEEYSLPADALKNIADYFGVSMEEMYNQPVHIAT